MKSQFALFGWIVSIAAHALFVFLLFTFGRPSPEMAPASPTPPEPSAEEASSPQPQDEPSSPPVSLQDDPIEPNRTVRAPADRTEINSEPTVHTRRHQPPRQTESPVETSSHKSAEEVETILYTVKRGESLTAIANRTGTTLQGLAKLNKTTVKKLSNLWVGQKIRVPASK